MSKLTFALQEFYFSSNGSAAALRLAVLAGHVVGVWSRVRELSLGSAGSAGSLLVAIQASIAQI